MYGQCKYTSSMIPFKPHQLPMELEHLVALWDFAGLPTAYLPYAIVFPLGSTLDWKAR